MWILNKLPQVWHPFFRIERFGRVTDDAFLLGIEARDQRFDLEATTKLLAGRRRDRGRARATSSRIRRGSTMPKWITAFIVSSTAFALIPFAIAAKARNSHSTEPHLHIFPDMDFQPKYKSDTADATCSPTAARTAARSPGTVARGSLQRRRHVLPRPRPSGAVDDRASRRQLDDQRARSCSAARAASTSTARRATATTAAARARCRSGVAASGGGVAAPATSSIRRRRRRVTMPNGQLFNTISNGYNTMMGYAAADPARGPLGDRRCTSARSSARERDARGRAGGRDHAGACRRRHGPAGRAYAAPAPTTAPAAATAQRRHPEVPDEPHQDPPSRREGTRPASSARASPRSALGIAVVFLGLSLDPRRRPHGDDWKRFFHAYVIGWSYIFSICVGVLWLVHPAPPGARSLGDGGAPDRRGDDRRVPARVRRGPRVRDPGARRLQGPLLLGAPRRARPGAQPPPAPQARLAVARRSSRSAT